MLYFPHYDVALVEYPPIMLRLVGQAIMDPPYRLGGYKIASPELERLLFRQACDLWRAELAAMHAYYDANQPIRWPTSQSAGRNRDVRSY